MHIIGAENIPKDGAVVLCSNHISMHDPIAIGIYIKRQPHFIAKKELFETKFKRLIFYGIGAFPVDREAKLDMNAMRTGLNFLKNGEMLGIFAEGTRVKAGEKGEAKAGVSMFALKGNAVVVPVAISGDYSFRSKVTIEYGEPMEFPEYREGKITSARLEEMTGKIMEKIEEMKIKNSE